MRTGSTGSITPTSTSRWRRSAGDHTGLLAASAFFPPAKTGNGLLSIGVYDFHDEHFMQAALAAPETDKVMADVTNFTDTTNIERSVWKPLGA